MYQGFWANYLAAKFQSVELKQIQYNGPPVKTTHEKNDVNQ